MRTTGTLSFTYGWYDTFFEYVGSGSHQVVLYITPNQDDVWRSERFQRMVFASDFSDHLPVLEVA